MKTASQPERNRTSEEEEIEPTIYLVKNHAKHEIYCAYTYFKSGVQVECIYVLFLQPLHAKLLQ